MEIPAVRYGYGAYWLDVLQAGVPKVNLMPITPPHIKGILGLLN
jgi:hypothetical protein